MGVTLTVSAQKASDELLKDLCRETNNMMQVATEADRQAVFDRQTALWSKKNDVRKLTPQQVEAVFLYGGYNLDAYLRRWLSPMLEEKAGANCDYAFLAWKYMPENDGFTHSAKETAALMLFLNSADLQKHLDAYEGHDLDVMQAMSTMKDANWQTVGFGDAIIRLLECNLSTKGVSDCVNAFNSVAKADGIDAGLREKVRLACLSQYNKYLTTLDNPRLIKAVKSKIAFLEGPFACGKLVGSEAPALHFIRAFKLQGDAVDTLELKGLDDFKGKVVMIDFWGTKCVPCVQSFPEMAKLQEYFKDKDVVILGVTSLQGYFADLANHRTVQCRNNPEKELGCFPPYMKAMGINWNIAITEEDVMNTDYGVLAIPHITIIDRNGVVRYNAVNASEEEKIKMIEGLL